MGEGVCVGVAVVVAVGVADGVAVGVGVGGGVAVRLDVAVGVGSGVAVGTHSRPLSVWMSMGRGHFARGSEDPTQASRSMRSDRYGMRASV